MYGVSLRRKMSLGPMVLYLEINNKDPTGTGKEVPIVKLPKTGKK